MTQQVDDLLEMLTGALSGAVLGPGHADYDAARRVWNADIDRSPSLIARCASADDVSASVSAAVSAGLEVAVRGGAHSFPGYSTCDGGLVIDLSSMNGVSVNNSTKRARVQGGALLGDLDRPPRRTVWPCLPE